MFVSDLDIRGGLQEINPLPDYPTTALGQLKLAFEQSRYEDGLTSAAGELHNRWADYLDDIERRTGEIIPNPMLLDSPRAPAPRGTPNTLERRLAWTTQRLTALRAKHPDLPIRSHADMIDAASRRLAGVRAELQKSTALSGSSWGGLARFAGGTLGQMADPGMLATMLFAPQFLPRAASTGVRAWLINQGARAVEEGLAGVVSQAVAEPFVWRWKEQIGSPYELADSLTNIAAAGVGGAALSPLFALVGAGARGGAKGLARAFRSHPRAFEAPPDVRGAATILEAEAEHAAASPHPATAEGEHLHAESTAAVAHAILDETPRPPAEAPARPPVADVPPPRATGELAPGARPEAVQSNLPAAEARPPDVIETATERGRLHDVGTERAAAHDDIPQAALADAKAYDAVRQDEDLARQMAAIGDDVQVALPGMIDEVTGQPQLNSARELLDAADRAVEASDLIHVCLTGKAA